MKKIEKLLEQELIRLTEEKDRSFFRKETEEFYRYFMDKVSSDIKDIEKIVENYFDNVEEYPVYTIPVHENDIAEYSDELNLMCPEKLKTKGDSEKIIVDELLFITGEKKLKKAASGRYEGNVRLEDGIYKVIVRLEETEDYINREKELYKSFLINEVRWNPFIMPYNDKFYRLAVYREDNWELEDKIMGKINKDNLSYDLGELEGEYFKNYHLMWNVFENKVVSEGYTVSHNEENIYIHQITEQGRGLTLVNPDSRKNLISVEQRNDFKIFVKTKLRQIDTWTIMTIKNIAGEKRYKEQKFRIISNAMNRNMINRLRYKYKNRIRSELEIYRISKAYRYLREIELKRVEIRKSIKRDDENTRNRYNYINDEITKRLEEAMEREKLVLSVDYPENMQMKKDKLDYYCSIVQFFFPEYECIVKGI